MSRHYLFATAACGLALFAASTAPAQSVAYNAPNYISVPGATSVTLNGFTFVNQGIVGTARLPADLHDFNGETLGSFSGMAIDLSTWRLGANGAYTASLYTLPDRGPNNIGGFATTDYAARLNKFSLTFSPYTGAAAVAASTQQAQLTPSGGFLLRDSTGQVFTGRDPQSGVVVRNGISYPTPPVGDAGFGKIAIDAEAVTFLRDGSFYVGDEYGAAIYYFDASGRQLGAIQANPDLLPRVNGAVNFNGTNDSPLVTGTTGRRSNQGMEGVSVSPDGTRLFAVLQSATLQDNPTNVAVRRNDTRVLVYDISANKTPTAPISEYVLQLPVYNNSATGTGAASATAAQSEVLALNNSQFLVLSRDGNGRGTNGNANAIAFKSVLLVDTAGATNIAGTSYSTGTTPISTTAAANGSGALVPGITPVQQVELVNMLNTAQLSKFGINTVTAPSTQYTLSEKWEAMGLVPVLEEGKPHDFFLLIGNDNDFVSHDIDAAGVTNANAALNSATAGSGDNDNVILIYRLTLPTYIDPQALAYLQGAAPYAMSGARVISAQLGSAPTAAGLQNVSTIRRARFAGLDVKGARGWAQGAFDRVAAPGSVGAIDAGGFSVGAEGGDNTFRYGFALSGTKYDSKSGSDFGFDGHGFGLGLYGAMFSPTGLYAQGGVSLTKLHMKTRRPASYGLSAQGTAAGYDVSMEAEIGYTATFGPAKIGPFINSRYNNVELDGYVEHGAAVGNGLIPDSHYIRVENSIGVEASLNSFGGVRPSVRVAYTNVDELGDKTALLTLAAVPGSAGSIALPSSDKNFTSAQLALEGGWRGFGWRVAFEARDTNRDTSGQVSFGFSKTF
ncbi:MAG: esterase-like activity of phytase family protein [Caulobacteraceae bacterium]